MTVTGLAPEVLRVISAVREFTVGLGTVVTRIFPFPVPFCIFSNAQDWLLLADHELLEVTAKLLSPPEKVKFSVVGEALMVDTEPA